MVASCVGLVLCSMLTARPVHLSRLVSHLGRVATLSMSRRDGGRGVGLDDEGRAAIAMMLSVRSQSRAAAAGCYTSFSFLFSCGLRLSHSVWHTLFVIWSRLMPRYSSGTAWPLGVSVLRSRRLPCIASFTFAVSVSCLLVPHSISLATPLSPSSSFCFCALFLTVLAVMATSHSAVTGTQVDKGEWTDLPAIDCVPVRSSHADALYRSHCPTLAATVRSLSSHPARAAERE